MEKYRAKEDLERKLKTNIEDYMPYLKDLTSKKGTIIDSSFKQKSSNSTLKTGTLTPNS